MYFRLQSSIRAKGNYKTKFPYKRAQVGLMSLVIGNMLHHGIYNDIALSVANTSPIDPCPGPEVRRLEKATVLNILLPTIHHIVNGYKQQFAEYHKEH